MKKRNEKKEHSQFLEMLAALFMLTAFVAVRFFYVRLFVSAPSGDGRFLQLSYIRLDTAPAYLSQSVADLYVRLLRTLFWFAGNKEMAGVWLQALLQAGGLFFLYLALRRVFGLPAAVFGSLALICLPILGAIPQLTPGCLLFFFTGIYLWMISCFFSRLTGCRAIGASGAPLLLFTGLYLGFLISADSVGLFAAAVTGIALLCAKRPKAENLFQNRWFQLFLLFLGALLGIVVCFWLKAEYYGHTLLAPYREYVQNYFTAETWNFLFRFGTGSLTAVCSAAVFSVLAAVRMRFISPVEKEPESPPVPGGEITVFDIDTLPTPEPPADGDFEGAITLFEEPLPKPKKHVRKEMNYAFDPEEAQMNYDIDEISEESGYDLP